MAHLAENRYGKSSVRVMKVVRHETHHSMKEWSVRVLLSGNFESCFTEADNSNILPTDTMKNTVYWLARHSSATEMESFALELTEHFLSSQQQVEMVTVEIAEKSWQPMIVDHAPHPTTYQMLGPELQTVEVTADRTRNFRVNSGVDGLMILKTTHSAFTGFLRDQLTTLPECEDRIFATRATVVWQYQTQPGDYAITRRSILDNMLKTFAEHNSLSVQHTLFEMGKAALAAAPELAQIKLIMPNVHCLLVDLSRFGQTNPNQIFVPTDEPSGYIEAVVERD